METDSNGLKKEDGECLLLFGFIRVREKERRAFGCCFCFFFFYQFKRKGKEERN